MFTPSQKRLSILGSVLIYKLEDKNVQLSAGNCKTESRLLAEKIWIPLIYMIIIHLGPFNKTYRVTSITNKMNV